MHELTTFDEHDDEARLQLKPLNEMPNALHAGISFDTQVYINNNLLPL